MPLVSFNTSATQLVEASVPVGSVLQLLESPAQMTRLQVINAGWRALTLALIDPGTLTEAQYSAYAKTLKLTDILTAQAEITKTQAEVVKKQGQAETRLTDAEKNIAALQRPATNDIKGTLITTADRFIYFNGKIYGLRRLVQADITGYTDRADVAPAGNRYAALNGTGNTDLTNASYQWLRLNFDSKNVWKTVFTHQNSDTGGNRNFSIGGTMVTISQKAGTYTTTWNSPSNTGYTAMTYQRYGEDYVRTIIKNWEISVSDETVPVVRTPANADATLVVGDQFRMICDGTNTLLRFDGIDPASKAWCATPVVSLTAFDNELIVGSKNAIENNAVAQAIANLKGSVPPDGNSLEKLWNAVQSMGQDWLIARTLDDMEAMGDLAASKYIRVLDTQRPPADPPKWGVYYGDLVFPADTSQPPTTSFTFLFGQDSVNLLGRVESLETQLKNIQVTDKEAPKLVLLDEVRDIVRGGYAEVQLRIYVDD